MKNLLTFLILTALLSHDIFAQSSVWKISKDGNELFIGGTIHLLREKDFPLPAEFDAAYKSSSILVFETDMSQLQTVEFQQKLMSKAMYPGDSTIKDVLSPETLTNLEKECTAIGLPFQQMHKLRPSVLILTIVVMHYQKLGINSPGVDAHFHELAVEDSKEILSFESIDSQIDLMANMGAGNEDEFVAHSLEDLQRVKEELLTLIKSWEEGDTKNNEKELKEMKKDYPVIYEDLLVKRNNNWMPQIESFFETQDIEFVLVGNLHLHGKDGILKQLSSKGYTIDQLK